MDADRQFSRNIEDLQEASAIATRDDPVIRRLSDALSAIGRWDDRFSGIYADALRLAITTKLLSFQSGLRRAKHLTTASLFEAPGQSENERATEMAP
jgi:hypothetical protein